ncbi:MAG: VWA domain-containing protein [Methylococcaceae bacterium]
MKKFVLLFTFIFLACPLALAATERAEPSTDTQVLIDVSGSMKKNDPANLRIPALKLLIDLLPQDSQAGIWLFGEKIENIASSNIASTAWKNQALQAAARVHSKGRYTDIEQALTIASVDWEKATNQQRNIILLTDGVVDIAKDQKKNRASRERIVQQIIPDLQSKNARVYSIALSNNVDSNLLKQIALETAGWNATANSAEELQKVFLRMFNKVAPRETLPLINNQFSVDNRIKEVSLLVFRTPNAPPTSLINPESIEIKKGNIPDNVKWRQESGYDIITISNPLPGTWQVLAKTDPDNQVMIVTDLKLVMSDLPNFVSEHEKIDFTAFFTDNDLLIQRKDFLDLVDIQLEQTDGFGHKTQWLLKPSIDSPGYFQHNIEQTLTPGKHEFKLLANGKTFQREMTRSMEVITTPITIEKHIDSTNRTATIQLIPDTTVIDKDSMKITAKLTEGSNPTQSINMEKNDTGWSITHTIPSDASKTIFNFVIQGKTVRGSPITPTVPPVFLNKALLSQPGKKQTPTENPTSSEPQEAESDNSELSILSTVFIVILINVLFAVLGFFLLKYIKKQNQKRMALLLEKI